MISKFLLFELRMITTQKEEYFYMRYMGSKNRLAKDIVPIIQSYISGGGQAST